MVWCCCYGYGSNWLKAFIAASPHPLPRIEKQVRFDDILLWNETSNALYRQMDPDGVAYFGPPSPKIDANWKTLLQWQYPSLSKEEIAMNEGMLFEENDRHPTTGKFHVALDVFHSLHCLNMVRMKLDDGYYHMDMNERDEGAGRDHIGTHAQTYLLVVGSADRCFRSLLEPYSPGAAVSA